ncbi:DUF2971 domain-containing protein [Sphingomonas sp. NPDC079357]|uniref:DUF2971 domain-containing protein n=1 Tax=Sphingomonas sp. NPDC079357 TaxID=3364518 RepID=UPI0038510B9D
MEKGSQAEQTLKQMIADRIKDEIAHEFRETGVLSLSATWSSVLMWSHYADEHRGICMEYDTSAVLHQHLIPVSYNASRAISTNDVVRWKFKNDFSAERRVRETYFYAKSNEWRYEKEWRDLDSVGSTEAPYELTAIYFGLRCDPAVRMALVKLLINHQDIKLYQIGPQGDTFKLRRRPVERDEIEQSSIRDPGFLYFTDIILDDEDESGDLMSISLDDEVDLGGDDDLGVEVPL